MFKKLAGLTAVAGLFVAGTASAEISGSAHDLAAEIASLDDICSICHAPHANESAGADGLLWNHTPSPNAGAYSIYTSDTLDGTSGQPGPVSTLCLSCHDGAVAVDSFGGTGGAALIGSFANGGTAFGTALTDDHPIGITYDPVLDTELNATTTGLTFNTTTGTDTGTIADLLFGVGGDVVECGSCHDVHNTDSNASVLGEALLRVANDASSSLCTTCHAK